MDIEILCKLPDDSRMYAFALTNSVVVPAILAFEDDFFSCINMETNALVKDYMKYSYTDVVGVLVRTRPEHADIR